MEEGWGSSLRGTPASRRLPVLIGALTVGLAIATVLGLHSLSSIGTMWTAGCPGAGRGRAAALRQSQEECHREPVQCGQEPHADVAWMQGPEGQAGGEHTCAAFERVCIDQGTLVMRDERYNMVNGSDMPKFDVTDLEVRPCGPDGPRNFNCLLVTDTVQGLHCTSNAVFIVAHYPRKQMIVTSCSGASRSMHVVESSGQSIYIEIREMLLDVLQLKRPVNRECGKSELMTLSTKALPAVQTAWVMQLC
jgi:hypothetical protein